MAFDPDTFLAEDTPPANSGARARPQFDPDAFLRDEQLSGSYPLAAQEGPQWDKKLYQETGSGFPANPLHTAQPEYHAPPKPRDEGAFAAAGFGSNRGITLGVGPALASDEYRRRDAAAKDKHPIAYGAAETVMGAVPALALSPAANALGMAAEGAAPAVQALARWAVPAAMGAVEGAASAEPGERLKGAAIGAGVGALANEGLHRAFRGAPGREGGGIIRDVMESDAGRATPTAGRLLAHNRENALEVVRTYPNVRAALTGPATEAQHVVRGEMGTLGAQLDPLYDRFDTIVPMTRAAAITTDLTNMRDGIRAYMRGGRVGSPGVRYGTQEDITVLDALAHAAETRFGNEGTVPTQALRRWATEAQSIADRAMGGINNTNTHAARQVGQEAVSEILNSHLDSPIAARSAGQLVQDIRTINRPYSGMVAIDRALQQRADKEQAEAMGLGARAKKTITSLARTAAAGLAFSGQYEKAAAVGAASVALPLADRGGRALARTINDSLMTPLADAAARGAPWGDTWQSLARAAGTYGLTEAAARALYARFQSAK